MSGFTKARVKNTFNRAAATYDTAAVIALEVAQRLDQRLDLMRIQPGSILDLGAGTGYSSGLLAKRYPGASIIAVDFADLMLRQAQPINGVTRICADADYLPLADSSVDLIVSNLMLTWCVDLPNVFVQMQRVLKPNGGVLFSTLGPDTLQEIRVSWASVDSMPHVHLFYDMHDVGDALLQAKLADPVMDAERIILSYGDVRQLLRDLKHSGMQNLQELRHKYLTGKNRLKKFLTDCDRWRDEESRLPVTYEVIYGHAWGVDEKHHGGAQEFSIPVSAIRRSKERE